MTNQVTVMDGMEVNTEDDDMSKAGTYFGESTMYSS